MQVLERMEHRGGCGCEVNTGDGSGALFAIPDTFYRKECKTAGVELPPNGRYDPLKYRLKIRARVHMHTGQTTSSELAGCLGLVFGLTIRRIVNTDKFSWNRSTLTLCSMFTHISNLFLDRMVCDLHMSYV